MKTSHSKTLFRKSWGFLLFALGMSSWGLVSAQPGSSLQFDGTGDYVVIPNSAQNNITGTSITLEAWIYPTAWKTDHYGGGIITKEGFSTSYLLRCGNNGQLNFNLGDGIIEHTLLSSTGALALNKWQHVAGTYDGATMRLYINGVLVNTLESAFTIAGNAVNLVLGSAAPFLGSRDFPGRMDEVRIWNVTRTPSQLLDGMYRELAGTETGLAAYYRMSDGVGATLTDNVSSGGTNGTITNAIWKTSTARLTSASDALKYRRAGSGLAFDGTDDYVAVPDDNAIDLTKNFTIEAWIKPTALAAGFGRILGKDGAYGLGVNNSTLRFTNYDVQDYDLSYALTVNEWAHIAVVFDNANDVTFYVNGINRGKITGSDAVETSTASLYIGSSSYSPEYFTGRIDELRMWSVPRSATEIQDNMLRAVNPASANLVAYFPFDDGFGSTLTDATANGLNGTLTNMGASNWVSAADREPLKVWQAAGLWQVDSIYVLGTAPSTSVTSRTWVEITRNANMNTGAAMYAGNVTIPSGSTLNNTSSQALNLNGSMINNGTVSGATSQMRFQDSTQKAILTGTGSYTQGQLYVTSPFGLQLEQDVTIRTLHAQSATGNLEINGQTLTISTNGQINGNSIVGGPTSNMAFINFGSTVFLPAITLNNVTLNKAAGIRLQGNVRIEGNLAINNGRVDLNLNTLTFGPNASVSTSSSFSNTRMIDASVGTVVKEFNQKGAFLFPVGDIAPTYSPIRLDFRGGTFGAGASASISVNNSTHPNNTSENHRLDRFWNVTQNNISSFTCRVDAWYDPGDVAGDEADETMLKSSKWDGTAWLILGNVDHDEHRIYGTVESFSDFTAGEEEVFAALPVELIAFTGEPRDGMVNLKWTTAAEINSDYFDVQRSENGKRFHTIGTLQAAGNSFEPRDYTFTDTNPFEVASYYRLRQVDIDGQVHFSNTIEVRISRSGIVVYPNPASEGFWVVTPNEATGTLFLSTVSGKLMKTVRLTGERQYVSTSDLPAGVYYGVFKLRGMKGAVEKIVIK